MLDHYIEGRTQRLSPEAPVPILDVERERVVLGGAGNVAANVVALGGMAFLVGVVGDDQPGNIVTSLAQNSGMDISHLVVDAGRPTTEKVRLVSGRHQIARYDRESTNWVGGGTREKLYESVKTLMAVIDVVVLVDYGKGVIAPGLFTDPELFRETPVVVDPKQNGYERFFPPRAILKPNQIEAERESRIRIKEPSDGLLVADILMNRLQATAVYITLGEAGGALATRSGIREIIPTRPVAVYDPTGAGDTVAAALAVALASGQSVRTAARYANVVASIAVTLPGTAVVSRSQLNDVIGSQL
jgi:rfaE bifunctional protein kinase chain/domain